MTRARSIVIGAAVTVLALTGVDPLHACTVCFGDPGSAQTRGMRGAILFLLLLVGLVQIGFLRLFWSFRQRSRALDERKKRFQIVRGGART